MLDQKYHWNNMLEHWKIMYHHKKGKYKLGHTKPFGGFVGYCIYGDNKTCTNIKGWAVKIIG